MNVRFSRREVTDLSIAWVALGVAFTAFYYNPELRALIAGIQTSVALERLAVGFVISMVTAGIGFLLHELAHKIVAIHYDQVAEFRADYNMLFLAVMGALAGFLFAAPGAVYHRGRLTAREHGLIALAGPVTNALLAVVFLPVFFLGVLVGSDFLALAGSRGLTINLFLATFNMLPFGPLDGKTVLGWSKTVFAGFFVPALLLTIGAFVVGFGF